MKYGDIVALGGLDRAVAEGNLLGLPGPKGAGKTAALSILTTLLEPDSGTALLDGVPITPSRKVGRAGTRPTLRWSVRQVEWA